MPDNSDKKSPFENLKRFRQSTGYFCGPAVLQVLLSKFGIEASQPEIAKSGSSLSRVASLGMSVNEMAKAAHEVAPNLDFWVKRDSSLFDIEKIIKEHLYPVGVNWQGVFESFEYGNELNIEGDESEDEIEDDGSIGDQGHYCVITGIDLKEGYVRMIDPYGSYAEHDRFFSTEVFEERWWDDLMETEGGVNKYTFESRLMFVLTQKNEDFPRGLGMKKL